jgi:hypothetical protein
VDLERNRNQEDHALIPELPKGSALALFDDPGFLEPEGDRVMKKKRKLTGNTIETRGTPIK